MSQPKNETLVLVLSLLITLGLVGSGVWWFTNTGVKVDNFITPTKENAGSTPTDQSIQDRISFGEKILIPGVVPPAKRAGVEAIAAGTYDKAIANLEAYLRVKPNDPEVLIFLNNAQIEKKKVIPLPSQYQLALTPTGL